MNYTLKLGRVVRGEPTMCLGMGPVEYLYPPESNIFQRLATYYVVRNKWIYADEEMEVPLSTAQYFLALGTHCIYYCDFERL